jgi:putative transposase
VRAHQAEYPVATQCRVLEVSTSGYYAWVGRKPSRRAREDAALSSRIRELHRLSDGTYVSPRLLDDLADEGLAVSRKRVARLMKAQGLQGASRRVPSEAGLRMEALRLPRGPSFRQRS